MDIITFYHPSFLYINSRFAEESFSSNTIDFGRIFKIPLVINIPYHTNPLRHSTLDISSTSFQHADYATNIPKSLYTNTEQQSPITSPTFSIVIENIQNKLNVLTLEQSRQLILKMIFTMTKIQINGLSFSKISSNKEKISKNNFMIILHYIKYKYYSLIGSNYIMHLNIILYIHLHPSNMHVLSQPVQKHQYGTSQVDH
jgi:hypothetical protein